MTTHRHIDDAAQSLLADTEPYLSCDECFDIADRFVESLLRDGTPPGAALKTHLMNCPICLEEAHSLAALVAADFGRSEGDATGMVDAAVWAG